MDSDIGPPPPPGTWKRHHFSNIRDMLERMRDKFGRTPRRGRCPKKANLSTDAEATKTPEDLRLI